MTKKARTRLGRPPGAEHRLQRITLLLEEFFLRNGYREYPVDAIAEALSCSKRTLYLIAPSKKALFVHVLDCWLEKIRTEGHAGAEQARGVTDKIAAYLKPGIDRTKDTSSAFWADIEALPEARSKLQAHQRYRIHSLESLIEIGIADGTFKSVNTYLVAEILLGAILRFDTSEFQERSGLGISEAFEALYDLVFSAIET